MLNMLKCSVRCDIMDDLTYILKATEVSLCNTCDRKGPRAVVRVEVTFRRFVFPRPASFLCLGQTAQAAMMPFVQTLLQ